MVERVYGRPGACVGRAKHLAQSREVGDEDSRHPAHVEAHHLAVLLHQGAGAVEEGGPWAVAGHEGEGAKQGQAVRGMGEMVQFLE